MAATLYFINNTIGDSSNNDWETFLLSCIQNKLIHFNITYDLLLNVYLSDPDKDSFWASHNLVWKSAIWDTYRDILFHDGEDCTSLIYADSYNISYSDDDDEDPLLPLFSYLYKGHLPYYLHCHP
jgi:hypothetical protein